MSEVCILSHIVRFLHPLSVPNAWIAILVNEEGHVAVHYMLHRKDNFRYHIVINCFKTTYRKLSYHVMCNLGIGPRCLECSLKRFQILLEILRVLHFPHLSFSHIWKRISTVCHTFDLALREAPSWSFTALCSLFHCWYWILLMYVILFVFVTYNLWLLIILERNHCALTPPIDGFIGASFSLDNFFKSFTI